MPYIKPFDRKSFEAWLRRLGRPIPELTRSVADSVWTEYLLSQERSRDLEIRAESLFDAMGIGSNKPRWTNQTEAIKEVFRGFAQNEVHTHTGTKTVYRWNEMDCAYDVDGISQKDEME